jgi:hypothetical protein
MTTLSPAQARLVYWLNGLAPVATNIVTPMVTYYRTQQLPLSDKERQLFVSQEVARQMVSGALGLVSYFGGGWLFNTALKKLAPAVNVSPLTAVIGGIATEFVAYALVRPWISADLTLKVENWVQHHMAFNRQKHPALEPAPANLKPPGHLFGKAASGLEAFSMPVKTYSLTAAAPTANPDSNPFRWPPPQSAWNTATPASQPASRLSSDIAPPR